MRQAIVQRRLPILVLALAPAMGCAGEMDEEQQGVFEALFAGQAVDGGSGQEDDAAAASDAGAADVDYPDVPETILRVSCGTEGCHGMNAPLAGLDLASPGYVDRLAGTVVASGACEGETLIDLENPENSLIYRKVEATAGGVCGVPMPLSGRLEDEEIEAILAWITDGAPDTPAGSTDEEEDSEDSGSSSEGEQDSASDTPGTSEPAGDALEKDGWSIASNPEQTAEGNLAANAIDGNAATRFTTSEAMSGDEWLRIDFGSEQTFSEVVLDYAASTADYPREYAIYALDQASDNASAWGDPVAMGTGDDSGEITISFESQTARYLVIAQTGSDETSWWSVHEIDVR